MRTSQILQEIERLPIQRRIWVIEKTLKSIREIENRKKMEFAVEELYEDYKRNHELTVFTEIDLENFYETR